MNEINICLPLIAISAPLIASILIYILGEHIGKNAREAITFISSAILLISVYSLVPHVLKGEAIEIIFLEIVKGVNFSFNIDAAGMVFACVASTLWVLTSCYSVGYMRGHGEKNQTGYFSAFAICIFATIGLCFSANLITFFIFFEILAIGTYPLVVHYRDEEGRRSGRKYLAYTLISGQIFFASIVIIYMFTGTLEFKAGGFIKPDMLPMPLMLILFIMMVGAGAVKAGLMPLHSWLPAAMVAPTPVSALLHAVAVVKAGAFCTLRVVLYVFGPEAAKACHGAEILSYMAVITIIVSSLIAIRKDNLKARLAFSTVGQLSYIILGISMLTPESSVGAIYHIVAHAFMKITLFMCAGAIFVTAHKKNISEMVGIGRRMPITMGAFTTASVALAGFPFFVGFVSKANIILGAMKINNLLFSMTLVVSALLALTYLMPVVLIGFKKDIINEEFQKKDDANLMMRIPLVITAVISVILGISPNFGLHLYTLAEIAAKSIFG